MIWTKKNKEYISLINKLRYRLSTNKINQNEYKILKDKIKTDLLTKPTLKDFEKYL